MVPSEGWGTRWIKPLQKIKHTPADQTPARPGGKRISHPRIHNRGAVNTTMTQSVLVPVDGSPLSVDALREALQIHDRPVIAYYVVDLFDPNAPNVDSSYEPMVGSDEWHARANERIEAVHEEAQDIAAEYDREIETDSDIGKPADLIVEYAETEPVDHILMGAHGRDDPDRAIFGDVACTVVARAPVSVTVVR